MDSKSVAQERLIAAFIEGADAMKIELRGYGLTETERAEIKAEALTIYGLPQTETVAA